jgi:hypothetical protein
MDIITWTAAAVMSMYFNMTSQPTNGNFVYNAEMQDCKVSAILSYKTSESDNSLKANTKHLYEYDEQDRVVSDQMLKWNSEKGEWVPVKCIAYEYSGSTIAMNYMLWNSEEGHYMAPTESVVYTMMGQLIASVEKYKKESHDGEMQLSDRYLMMGGGIYNLLAGK